MIEIKNDSKYLNKNREYVERFNDDIIEDIPKYHVIKDGYILPKSELYLCSGGVVDTNRQFVKESTIDNEGSFICIEQAYDFSDYDDSQYDKKVIYLGYFFRHWGHFLMDCTTRMWVMLEEPFNDYKVAFPDHPANIRDGNYNRFLELLGISQDRILIIERPTRFKEIIVPDECRIESKIMHMSVYDRIFDKVVSNAIFDRNSKPGKVYFSRTGFGKPEMGEEEIEHNFEINGYTILHPEQLSLDEQIGLFQTADEVVSENSSICMNVVFARKGLKWVVINKYSAVHDNFTELRYSRDIDTTYIDAFSDKLDFFGDIIGSLPYLVSFNKNMENYFVDRGYMYEKYGFMYRAVNILRYLCKSCTIMPKRRAVNIAAGIVRWMKRDCPWIYRFLKRIQSTVRRE